jgi:alkylated DNA nucleotide flippase Atl1
MDKKNHKSWIEKLHESNGLPKVSEITESMSKRWGEGTFVIPAPEEVYEIMASVPKGKLLTISEVRKILAKKHNATIGCPLTTGIFAWISANAAEEEVEKGIKKKPIPYWRTLKTGGELNEKYPGGVDAQANHLEKEGFTIIPAKGKKPPIVKDYEKYLIEV